MAMQINTNIAAANAYRHLNNTQGDMNRSLERLSSGLRINRAADDAAGLAIAEGLRSQVNGLGVAIRNAQDGISVVQTAEGALTEVHSILQRVRDLSVQAANDSNNAESRTAIQTEIDQLALELDRIKDSTNFNGTELLDGSTATLNFWVGAGSTAAVDQIAVDLTGADLTAVQTAVAGVDTTDATTSAAGIAAMDTQIQNVSTARANLGAVQNRFEHTVRSLSVAKENLAASESRIRDADMAEEMVKFSRSQILQQAGTAMLAQANASNQGVLQLLG